ncbi:MAG: DUF302 domain-containing protein [Calditrichia bacterium]
MSYYISTIVKGSFDEIEARVRSLLQEQGFGILTEIDVSATLKKKLDVNFKPYKILGACNPPFAYKALQAEDKVGTMLPCNVIMQLTDKDKIEVAAIDPVASMQAINNPDLNTIAEEIKNKLKTVISSLK